MSIVIDNPDIGRVITAFRARPKQLKTLFKISGKTATLPSELQGLNLPETLMPAEGGISALQKSEFIIPQKAKSEAISQTPLKTVGAVSQKSKLKISQVKPSEVRKEELSKLGVSPQPPKTTPEGFELPTQGVSQGGSGNPSSIRENYIRYLQEWY